MMNNWQNSGLPFSARFNPKLQKLRMRLLNDPYYRMQSWEEVTLAVSLGIRIDPNHATVDDWLRLPGLSIHQARSLVELSRGGVIFYCIDDIAAALTCSVQRLLPLEPILNFSYYEEDSLALPAKLVNPNQASVELLIQVPFIDLPLAQAIIENRQLQGAYRNLADFQQRLCLSPDTISQLMYYLKF